MSICGRAKTVSCQNGVVQKNRSNTGPCQYDAISTRCRVKCQHDAVPRRRRVKTTSSYQNSVVSAWRRSKATRSQCDVVSKRHRVNTTSYRDGAVPTPRRGHTISHAKQCSVNTMPCQYDVVPERRNVNATSCQHDVVSRRCRVRNDIV